MQADLLLDLKAIGFDFDKTLGNINLLHNNAWLYILKDLSLRILLKEFFIWPVSKFEKYDNYINITNCLFRNQYLLYISKTELKEKIKILVKLVGTEK